MICVNSVHTADYIAAGGNFMFKFAAKLLVLY